MARLCPGRSQLPPPSQLVYSGADPETSTTLGAPLFRRVCRHTRTSGCGGAAQGRGTQRIHPAPGGVGSSAARLLCRAARAVVDGTGPILRCEPAAHLGFLAARAALVPSPNAAHRLLAPAE